MKISSAYRMRNKEIFHRVEEETNILHRNCPINHVIQGIIRGRVDVTGR